MSEEYNTPNYSINYFLCLNFRLFTFSGVFVNACVFSLERLQLKHNDLISNIFVIFGYFIFLLLILFIIIIISLRSCWQNF